MKLIKALTVLPATAALAIFASPVANAQARTRTVIHNGSFHGHPGFHGHGRTHVFVGGFGFPYFYGYPYWGWSYPYYYGYPYGYPVSPTYGYDSNGIYQGRVANPATNGGGKDASVATRVQRQLAAGGYYDGAIDGVVGQGTRQAIRSYQRANRLPVDGRIDNQLLGSMGLG